MDIKKLFGPKVIQVLRNDFFIAFLFLTAYLLTSPYIYGWDDQHLEIPILKHLIDPALFQGDYYVESATKYFTSWLYPILAKVITVNQIPTVYYILFVISRYVMFFWVYRLWLWISGNMFSAISATLMFFLLGRTDEFLYRSFCHEEFSFMFMFAGLYFFYREWYLPAAIIFGLGVNFHAIYNLFPMLYMLTYFLFCHPQRFKLIGQTGIAFVITSLPFLCWQIPISISRELIHPVPVFQWMPLYFLSCPQNFLFGSTPIKEVYLSLDTWLKNFAPYLYLMGMIAFQFIFNPMVRKDKKLYAIIGLSWFLIVINYFFDYVHPHRFVLDLNLVRVGQYMRFFMMGYTTIWACQQIRDSKPWLAFSAAVLVVACATTNLIGLFVLGIVSLIYIADSIIGPGIESFKRIMGLLAILVISVIVSYIGYELRDSSDVSVYFYKYLVVLLLMAGISLFVIFQSKLPWIKTDLSAWLRKLLIIVPLAGAFIISVSNAMEYYDLRENGPGPWQMLRDWYDMQYYVRDHTPKDAMIMTPYDMIMGGFRIHSDRKVLVCFRDCGIIGFDYAAAVEWHRRIKDIEAFKIYTGDRVDDTVLRAVLKYRIDYVVFMKYYGPSDDNTILRKVYENTVFSLFQVL